MERSSEKCFMLTMVIFAVGKAVPLRYGFFIVQIQ